MTQGALRPFLITKDEEEGGYRLTVRDTRYNSQGYPIVTSTLRDEIFKTIAAAKEFAQVNYNANPSEYARK